MFGRQDSSTNSTDSSDQPILSTGNSMDTAGSPAPSPASSPLSLASSPSPLTSTSTSSSSDSQTPDSSSSISNFPGHTSAPEPELVTPGVPDITSPTSSSGPNPSPTGSFGSTPTVDDSSSSVSTKPSVSSNDLLDIKQQALQQIKPLVGQLDQSPEERFQTTMMMIQGSDDQSLIKDAYAAAQEITDEKAKAQALLDVVNEINYFTHRNESESEA